MTSLHMRTLNENALFSPGFCSSRHHFLHYIYIYSLLYQIPWLKTHHPMFSGLLLLISLFPTISYSYNLSLTEDCHMFPHLVLFTSHLPLPSILTSYLNTTVRFSCLVLFTTHNFILHIFPHWRPPKIVFPGFCNALYQPHEYFTTFTEYHCYYHMK